MSPSPLLTAAQAAELLAVPESFVRAEARADRIPHIKLGARYVRFEHDALQAWLAGRRRGPQPRSAPSTTKAKEPR